MLPVARNWSEEYRGQPSIPLWLVWSVALGFVFGGLGSFAILDNNEGLYAEIAREMLASDDWRAWVIPHLNGLPYLEKPPLLYWLTALSFAAFGESEWSARLVPALSSLSCVGMLIAFGNAVHRPSAARLAALMFVSGTGIAAMSHLLMFDMLLTALLTAALMSGYLWLLGDGRPTLLRLSYAFLALAVLAKGFVAVILYGMVLVFFTLASTPTRARFLRTCAKCVDPTALAVFFAIAAPWHLLASLVEPTFAWFYFVNEHVLRFLGRREPHDYYSGPWWYYLPRMAIYLFPWSFLLFGMAVSQRLGKHVDDEMFSRFLFIAWLAPLVFFSMSNAKANYYLVVVIPFAALHLATALEDRNFLALKPSLFTGSVIAACVLGLYFVLVARVDQFTAVDILGMTQRQFLFCFLGGLATLALAAALVAWLSEALGLLAYLVLPVWTAAGLVVGMQALEPNMSTRRLAVVLNSELADRDVYLYRSFEEQSSLPFYLKRTVPVLDGHSSDLWWGSRLHANHIMVSGEQLFSELTDRPAAIVVRRSQMQDFISSGMAARFDCEKKVGENIVFFSGCPTLTRLP